MEDLDENGSRIEIEDDDSFELDIDGDGGSIDDVLREAVEAVDRHREDGRPAAGDAGPPSGPATPDDPVVVDETGQKLKDQLMRTLADFENFRKRSEREKADLRRFALVEPLKDFLGVLDNLERATSASGSADDLRQGVQMIVKQLEELLRRYHVQPVEADGAPFDPAVHEAVARVESAEVVRPTVVQVLQRGYCLHDRLLRPALVNVAMPSKPAPAPPAPADGEKVEESTS